MKDFFSKATFGFLMAQFVPGAIVVYSLTFLVVAFTDLDLNSFTPVFIASSNRPA